MSPQIILVNAVERRGAGMPDDLEASREKEIPKKAEKATSLNFLGRWIQLHLHDTSLIARITAQFLAILFRPFLGQIESRTKPRMEEASLEVPLRGVVFNRSPASLSQTTQVGDQSLEKRSRGCSPSTVPPSSSTSAIPRIKPPSCETQQPQPRANSSSPLPSTQFSDPAAELSLQPPAPINLENNDLTFARPSELPPSHVVMSTALEKNALERLRAQPTVFLSLPLDLQKSPSFQAQALQVNPLVGMLFPESSSNLQADTSQVSRSRGFHAVVERVLDSL